jgi:hypothetical protein
MQGDAMRDTPAVPNAQILASWFEVQTCSFAHTSLVQFVSIAVLIRFTPLHVYGAAELKKMELAHLNEIAMVTNVFHDIGQTGNAEKPVTGERKNT